MLILLPFVLALPGGGKKFEGTITWSMQYTISNVNREQINLPKSYTMKVGGHDYSLTTDGGIHPSTFLWKGEEKRYYQLDGTAKTYKIVPVGNLAKEPVKPSVINTGEQCDILGHRCTKYVVTPSSGNKAFQAVYWTTADLKGLNMKTMPTPGTGGNISQSLFHEYIDGIPLRIEYSTPTFNVVLVAMTIQKGGVRDNDLSIPADFKESK